MTRKDYELIAAIFCDNSGLLRNDFGTIAKLAEELSQAFAKDNPRFNSEKFLDACGIN